MGLESKLGNMGVVTARLEDVVNWGRTNAMWPLWFWSGVLRHRNDVGAGQQL